MTSKIDLDLTFLEYLEEGKNSAFSYLNEFNNNNSKLDIYTLEFLCSQFEIPVNPIKSYANTSGIFYADNNDKFHASILDTLIKEYKKNPFKCISNSLIALHKGKSGLLYISLNDGHWAYRTMRFNSPAMQRIDRFVMKKILTESNINKYLSFFTERLIQYFIHDILYNACKSNYLYTIEELTAKIEIALNPNLIQKNNIDEDQQYQPESLKDMIILYYMLIEEGLMNSIEDMDDLLNVFNKIIPNKDNKKLKPTIINDFNNKSLKTYLGSKNNQRRRTDIANILRKIADQLD